MATSGRVFLLLLALKVQLVRMVPQALQVQVLHPGVRQVKYRKRKVIQIMILSGVPPVIFLLAELPIRY
jgi:hypothetical protein